MTCTGLRDYFQEAQRGSGDGWRVLCISLLPDIVDETGY
jgi:hypothetical protein